MKRLKLWLRRMWARWRGSSTAADFALSVRDDLTLDEYERALMALGIDPDEPVSYDTLRDKARVRSLDEASRFVEIVSGDGIDLRSGYTLEAARQVVSVAAALFFSTHKRPQDEAVMSTLKPASVQALPKILQERLSGSAQAFGSP